MKQSVKIKKLWKGRFVPVLFGDLGTGTIVIQIDKRGRSGELLHPYYYQINDDAVRTWNFISRPSGAVAYAVPLSAFRKVAKRQELFKIVSAESMPSL
ncbi:MAG: hypothetical protein PHU03_03050 [Syntrophales bacterium]|nr:hypothetical protein [Syntrophales bacterium]